MGAYQRRKCPICNGDIPGNRRKYCSANCIKKAWKLRNPDKMKEQHMKDNKKWRKYQVTFEKKNPNRLKEIKRDYHIKRYFGGIDLIRGTTEPACYFCGKTKNETELCMHHKDMDRTNNTVGNLEVLCAACHIKTHYLIRELVKFYV